MKPIILDCEQRTPEWYAARCGRVCGSEVADIYATRKSGGEAAGVYNLRAKLVLERITGRPQEGNGYVSPAMQAGIEREAAARKLYEAETGELVVPVGFVQHPELLAGCSPDGVIFGPDGERIIGGVEVKSPLASTHLEYLTTKEVPRNYRIQCVHALWITGAEWWDWFSYHPDFPEPARICLARIHRDDAEIAAHELMVRNFLKTVDAKVEELQKLIGVA